MCIHQEVRDKWDRIADRGGVDHGSKDCAYCQKYFYGDTDGLCEGCPIFKDSGGRCSGSPYKQWSDHQENWHCLYSERKAHKDCDHCQELSNDMRDYVYKITARYMTLPPKYKYRVRKMDGGTIMFKADGYFMVGLSGIGRFYRRRIENGVPTRHVVRIFDSRDICFIHETKL